MFKKLQNLLFEDEGEEFEDEMEEEAQPVKTKPAAKPTPVVNTQPEVKKSEPAMTRIDVTQPIPSIVKKEEPVVTSKPATQHASPKPIVDTPVKSEPAKMPSLGITVDEVKKPVEKPVRNTTVTTKKSAPKNATPHTSSIYEFKPVISPMFGVDEKDMDAMQVTANVAKTAALNDAKSNIISPIYGMNQEARPTNIQTTVEKSNEMENLTYTKEAQKAEDALPSFSLDDILNSREDDSSNDVVKSVLDEKTEIVDETIVLDANNLSPFGHVNAPNQKKGK